MGMLTDKHGRNVILTELLFRLKKEENRCVRPKRGKGTKLVIISDKRGLPIGVHTGSASIEKFCNYF